MNAARMSGRATREAEESTPCGSSFRWRSLGGKFCSQFVATEGLGKPVGAERIVLIASRWRDTRQHAHTEGTAEGNVLMLSVCN